MTEYALLVGGQFQEIRHYPERPVDIPHKEVEWFPVVREYGEPSAGVEGDTYVVRTADPATLPEPVPSSISPRQARLVLLAAGKLDEANALIADSDTATRISWEFATQVNRDDPGIIGFASALGFTSGQLDDMFRNGAKL
jgi:hypothetical protein